MFDSVLNMPLYMEEYLSSESLVYNLYIQN